MKIEKLPSGSYRIRKTYQKKTYTIIVDYKPTQKQAIELLADKLKESPVKPARHNMTFSDAYHAYMELKSNILSPSTKKGYKIVYNRISDAFKKMLIDDITSVDVQKEINDDSADHAPKSVSNLYGLISVVLNTYRENLILRVHLPQKIKKEPYIPTTQEVQKVMDALKDTKYYVPTALAVLGLRRSEICAATIDDLSDTNMLTINKAKVESENGFEIKTTKTTESTRVIQLPPDLANLIREQGFIYDGFLDGISRNLKRIQTDLGINHFSLHKLRHFFVSYAHNELKLSDEQIMKLGGWKTSNVMMTVYRHSMNDDETKTLVADKIGGLL